MHSICYVSVKFWIRCIKTFFTSLFLHFDRPTCQIIPPCSNIMRSIYHFLCDHLPTGSVMKSSCVLLVNLTNVCVPRPRAWAPVRSTACQLQTLPSAPWCTACPWRRRSSHRACSCRRCRRSGPSESPVSARSLPTQTPHSSATRAPSSVFGNSKSHSLSFPF